ncbi:ABC transporter ATP-binding protein/permease [Candidatus Pelagibacter sp.]|nr:ABC transporter ATP-binding protein/permease [Candidatus Pelagibacter sp.]
MEKILKIYRISTNKAKLYYGIFFIVTILNSLFEIAVLFSILPFLEYFISGNGFIINQINKIINYFFEINNYDFLKLFTFLVMTIFFIKLIFNILNVYIYELILANEHSFLYKKLLNKYLKSNYGYLIKIPSSLIIKNLNKEVPTYINGILANCLITISEVVLTIFIITALVIYNLKITILSLFLFFTLSFIYVFFSKNYVSKFAHTRLSSDSSVFKKIINIFDNLKIIKIYNRENFFIEGSKKSFDKSINSTKYFNIISKLPRIIFEFTLLIIIVLTIFFYLDEKEIIYTIAVFAAASIRIIPSISKLSAAWQNLKFSWPSLSVITEVLDQNSENLKREYNSELRFEKSINLKSLYYSYQNDRVIIKNLDFEIKKNNFIGIVGKTGSGKSTLVDLITGLIFPTDGSIEIDNVVLNKNNVINWQKKIGYMPQNISVLNDTIRANVAFGLKTSDVDNDKIMSCLQKAQLGDFYKKLKDGLNTIIDEKGLNLSGGEKQRLALARMLYFDPQIIILDESTSSLDGETEEKILNDIKLLKDTTVIFVTHREKNLQLCDKVVTM